MDAGMIEAVRRSGGHRAGEGSGPAELPASLVRAGRAILGWSRLDLSRAAGVSISSLLRVEAGDARSGAAEATRAANARVREALQAAGLSFAVAGQGGRRLGVGSHEVGLALRAPGDAG